MRANSLLQKLFLFIVSVLLVALVSIVCISYYFYDGSLSATDGTVFLNKLIKSKDILIAQHYYYNIQKIDAVHGTTTYHLVYKNNNKCIEICDNVSIEFGLYREKVNFKWKIYSDNIVYVQQIMEEPFEKMILYSPRTGYHVLIDDYSSVAELKYDDTGILYYLYDESGNTPDYSKPHKFTAKELAGM